MSLLAFFVCLFSAKFIMGFIGSKLSKQKDEEIVEIGFFQMVLFYPVIEELLFRGIPLLVSQDIFSVWFIASHILFCLAHITNFKSGFIFALPQFILSAVAYSYAAVTWGIEWSIVFHVANNLIAYILLLKRVYKLPSN